MKPVALRLPKGVLKHNKEDKNRDDYETIRDIAANVTNEKIKREIYLTFDDGLEAGTEEVLELLKEKGVKGTFFLIGKRVESMYKRNKDLCLNLLNDIYENHAIGNHSYSHANEFYADYYRNGGVVIKVEEGKKKLRTVVDDFAKAKNTILYYLELAKGKSNPSVDGYSDSKLVSKTQKRIIARFPGTKTWFIKNQIVYFAYSNRGLDGLDIIPIRDTKEEAQKIGQAYNIFGWDLEWSITQKLKYNKVIKNSINEKIKNGTIQYDNIDHTDPFFDLYSAELIDYDRCVEKMELIKNRIIDLAYPKREAVPSIESYSYVDVKTKKNGKVVLLMHERQFRQGKKNKLGEVDINDKSELNKLGNLIDELKKNKFIFKTLDEY